VVMNLRVLLKQEISWPAELSSASQVGSVPCS
jgi:hypothetical protein